MLIDNKAWGILLPDEKMALSLQHGLDKSSWESGEILNRAHYKYLEIKYRAEHFLKILTEYLEIHDELFPNYLTGNKVVIQYFKLCINERKKPLIAIMEISSAQAIVTKKVLNENIIKTLSQWDKGDNLFNKQAMELVKDFDRWNNFRILPKEIQEPSAFKRRIKNSYKKQIRVIKSIHPIALQKLKKLYETKNSPYVYVPLLSSEPEVYKMKLNLGSLEIFNSLGIYIFKEKETADKYIQEVHLYSSKEKKECIDGLNFWPNFREIIKEAHNYQEVMKISSSRKYLQLAMEKFQLL